jgi:hypothetical protein
MYFFMVWICVPWWWHSGHYKTLMQWKQIRMVWTEVPLLPFLSPMDQLGSAAIWSHFSCPCVTPHPGWVI